MTRENVVHLINDADIKRGGAQRVLNIIANVTNSYVLDKKNKSNYTVLSKSYHWLIDVPLMLFSLKPMTVVIHSRCFFYLVPFLKLLNVDVVFYCHAQYKSKSVIFRLVKFARYISVSNSTKEYLVTSGVEPSRIVVIPNPLLQTNSLPDVPSMSNVDFAFIGGLHKWKGILELIPILDEYSLFVNEVVTLHVVGDGPLYSEVKSLKCKCKNLNVVLYGYRSDPFSLITEVPNIIIPSHEEGFGLIAIEAIFHNKNILYNEIPALKEICECDPLSFSFIISEGESFRKAMLLLGGHPVPLSDFYSERRKEVLRVYGINQYKKSILKSFGR